MIIPTANRRGTVNEGINLDQGRDFSDLGAGNIYGYSFFDNKDFMEVSFSGGNTFISRGRCFVKYNKANEPFTVDNSKEGHWMKCELTADTIGNVLTGVGYLYIEVTAGLTDTGSVTFDGSDYFEIKFDAVAPTVGPHIGLLYRIDGTLGVVLDDYRKFRDAKLESLDIEENLTIGGDTIISGDLNVGGDTIIGGSVTTTELILPDGNIQDQLDNIISSGIPTEYLVDLDTYLTGEDVYLRESLFVEEAVTFADATSSYNVGDVASNTRLYKPQVGTGIPGSSMKVSLAKVSSPSVDFGVRLESDLNGQPSGTLVVPGASGFISAGSVTGTLTDTTINLTSGITNNLHGVVLNDNQLGHIQHEGVKFTFTSQSGIFSVTKIAACTATKAYIYSEIGVLIQTAPFVGNIATFNNEFFINGETYIVLVGSDGAPYTSVKQLGVTSFPYVSTKLDYIAGYYAGPSVLDVLNVSGAAGTFFTVSPEYTFTVNSNCLLDSVADIGQNAQIYLGGTLLETGVLGTFSGTLTLLTGNVYKVRYAGGAVSTHYTTATFPEVDTNITYLSSSFPGGFAGYKFAAEVTTRAMQEDNANIYNIVSIDTYDSILIPKGVEYHEVYFQGTYGAETINAVNYYRMGYKLQNTTTREGGKYDGAGRSPLGLTDVTDTGVALLGGGNTTAKVGFRFQAIGNIVIKEANKHPSDTSTFCYIENDLAVVIEVAPFIGNVATFSGSTKFTAGTFFKIETDSAGANRIAQRRINSRGPAVGTNLTFFEGTVAGVNFGNIPNSGSSIVSVVSQVYFPDYFFYSSSNMATALLLSKTNALYSYKIPRDIPRIAIETSVRGTKCVTAVYGSIDFPGIQAFASFFIANSPGVISLIPGTYKYNIGYSYTDNLFIDFNRDRYAPGVTDIIFSDDVVYNGTNGNAAGNNYIKVKGITVNERFSANIYFELRYNTGTGAGSSLVNAQIHVNGIAIGTIRTNVTGTYAGYTQVIQLNAGDEVQIYASGGRATTNSYDIRFFRILGTLVTSKRYTPYKSF